MVLISFLSGALLYDIINFVTLKFIKTNFKFGLTTFCQAFYLAIKKKRMESKMIDIELFDNITNNINL